MVTKLSLELVIIVSEATTLITFRTKRFIESKVYIQDTENVFFLTKLLHVIHLSNRDVPAKNVIACNVVDARG